MDRPAERPELRMPRDQDAERTVLSCMLFDASLIDTAVEQLNSDDFFFLPNKETFAALGRLAAQGKEIGLLSLADELKLAGQLDAVGGVPYLIDLSNWEHGTSLFEYAIESVRNKALQRRVVETAQAIVAEGLSDQTPIEQLVASTEDRINSLVSQKWKPSYASIRDVATLVYEAVKQRMTDETLAFGVPTGFRDLDRRTFGLQRGNLIILAARPGLGKTALALNFATNAAKAGKPVVVFSLEMSREELGFRIMSSEGDIDGYKLRTGHLDRDEVARFLEAYRNVQEMPMVIDDTPAITIMELRARARRLKREGKCAFIIVDYLQLVRSSPGIESREQQIAEISRSLKALAKELEVPVLALSQLNRSVESRKPPKPMLSDLRESGAIEQDADVILFIYREGKYDEKADQNKAEIIIGKQRNGATGSIEMAFFGDRTRFADLAKPQDQGSL